MSDFCNIKMSMYRSREIYTSNKHVFCTDLPHWWRAQFSFIARKFLRNRRMYEVFSERIRRWDLSLCIVGAYWQLRLHHQKEKTTPNKAKGQSGGGANTDLPQRRQHLEVDGAAMAKDSEDTIQVNLIFTEATWDRDGQTASQSQPIIILPLHFLWGWGGRGLRWMLQLQIRL